MAGTDRQPSHPVDQGTSPFDGNTGSVTGRLLQNAHHYSFFEVVRMLHGLHRDAPKLGQQGPSERERIRVRPLLSLTFPPADVAAISKLEMPNGDARYQLDVTFMGLYGAATPLPVFYTEDLIRLEDDESLLRGFLDLFHHRLFSLLFRVWEKYRHTVQYDSSGKDYYSNRLLTMIGAALSHLPDAEKIRPGRLLAYAGLLTQQPRSAESLRALLQDHFSEAPVELDQCRGRWCRIDARQQNRLGQSNCTLGADFTSGAAVFDRAGNFGVNVGPMRLKHYLALLPDGDDMSQMRELVDLFNNDCLDYEVTLTLHGEEVPRAQLSAPHTRLGWSSWLGESSGDDRTVTFKFKGWKHG